jgi:hypothetical protein
MRARAADVTTRDRRSGREKTHPLGVAGIAVKTFA